MLHLRSAGFILASLAIAALAGSVQPQEAIPPKLPSKFSKTCSIKPKGAGSDDTTQILSAISTCGNGGHIQLAPGSYNITRKMTWNLQRAMVSMHDAWLNFKPDVEFWLDPDNTYRAIFIQSQASWFVVTGQDFVIDAGNSGGIEGNGQTWWNFFANRTRQDGDGRPVSLSLVQAHRGIVKGFRIDQQPFWCNAASNSTDILYDGMFCNATNTNPEFAGTNLVPNTDGINTYRSNRITMRDWDITCGDDCLAIKGNSSNIIASGVTCRGGNGIAFGSLGQYVQFDDNVDQVLIEDVKLIRLPTSVQPNMANAVYFKSWGGSVNGLPPTGGGGAGGLVTNVLARNINLDRVSLPLHLYQTNGAHSGDLPSKLQFQDLTFSNWTGTAVNPTLVNLQCSSAAPCPNMTFSGFDVAPPAGVTPKFICVNVVSETGLPGPCTPS